MSKQLKTLSLLAIFVCFAVLVSPSYSQTTNATLSGVVEDAKGAVVPGCKVTITNPATGLRRDVTTNEDGAYTIPQLPPATYTVMAEATGFKRLQVSNVVLNVGDERSLRIELEVGSVTSEVTVRPDGYDTVKTSPEVSTTVDRNFVGSLPLNGRSFQSLILLTPGIVGTVSNGLHPGEFSVNGQRQTANYFTVDGVSANTGVSTSADSRDFSQQAGGALPGTTALGTTSSLVSVDALEEFKIQTSSYSAEFGRQPGAQVQLLTRSGSNQLRGSVFEYIRNDAFDARDWFANANRLPKAALRQNQFGGTVSGPIFLPRFGEDGSRYWSGKNRTFFFFSYEGQRLRLPVITTTPRVPALRIRQEAATSLQPFLNAFPLPTGPEIIGQFCTPNPGALQVIGRCGSQYRVIGPTGSAPFAQSFSSPSNVDAYSIRLDHTVNSKLALFGRYSDTPSNSFSRSLNQLTGTIQETRSLTLGSTLSISTALNNEFRFNYSRDRGQNNNSMDDLGGAVPISLSQMMSGYNGPGAKFGFISIAFPGSGFSINLGDAVVNYSRQFNIVDNLSWIKGAHQIKVGIDWRRLNPVYGPFANLHSLDIESEANLINGILDNVAIGASIGAKPIYDNYSAYAQDNWRATRRLTLDLGLRWELNPAPHDANGVRPVVLANITPPDVTHATIASPTAPYYKTFRTAFAPRIGLAYQLRQTSGRETVVRGGFGVYYDLGSGWASSLFDAFPFYNEIDLSNVRFPLSPAQAQPPPPLPVPTQVSSVLAGQDFNALDPHLRLPYTLEWNVALEQSLGQKQTVSLSYVASAARRLTSRTLLNVPPVGRPRPNPNLGSISYVSNGPASDYESLQAQYQRRLSSGLQALVNYTWSHAIDQVSNEFDFGVLDRGNADFDVRHNFSAAASYDLPRLASSRAEVLRGIFNGWSVDSVVYARTGVPVNLLATTLNRTDGSRISIRPDLVSGVPVWIADASVPGGRRLNNAAFALPPADPAFPTRYVPGRQGTLGRNALRLPGIYQINMAVRRQFSLSERLKLQLKAEAFNVLNHPLFGGYGTSIGVSTLGVPQAMMSSSMGGLNSLYQIGGPRSMQFSLRLSY